MAVTAEQMAAIGAIGKALEQYPTFADFLRLPGIGPIILKASSEQWAPARLQAEIQNSEYWRSTSDAQRSWDLTRMIDPAEATRQMNLGRQKVVDIVGKLGADRLTPQFVNDIATLAVRDGWDERTIQTIALAGMQGHGIPKTGDLAGQMQWTKGMASSYGLPMSDGAAFTYAKQLVTGRFDQAGVQGTLAQQAIDHYGSYVPGLKDAVTRGQTVRQWADPYIQSAAQLLNVAPDQVDLTNPKWNKFLTEVDPKTGQPMNLTQWQQTLRTDPTYGYDQTPQAKQDAAQLTTKIAQTFGAL